RLLHARRADRAGGAGEGDHPRAGGRRLLRPATSERLRGERMTWVNQVVTGVLLGGYYAVLACGLSLMFGVMRIINLAHGDLAVLGAYVILVVVEQTGGSAFVAFAVALPAMIVIGYVLQLTILERTLKAGILTPLLATFGLSIVVQNLLQIVFSPDVHSLGGSAGSVTTASWQLAGLSVSALGIVIV